MGSSLQMGHSRPRDPGLPPTRGPLDNGRTLDLPACPRSREKPRPTRPSFQLSSRSPTEPACPSPPLPSLASPRLAGSRGPSTGQPSPAGLSPWGLWPVYRGTPRHPGNRCGLLMGEPSSYFGRGRVMDGSGPWREAALLPEVLPSTAWRTPPPAPGTWRLTRLPGPRGAGCGPAGASLQGGGCLWQG